MWEGNTYKYTASRLKNIAGSYESIYEDGISFYPESEFRSFEIAEYKADFDTALHKLGKGTWTGKIDACDFKTFRHFGRLQRIVIADIYSISDNELEGLGFYDIPKLRGLAYWRMTQMLDGKASFPVSEG